jgi:type I restriction enzyme R subunit
MAGDRGMHYRGGYDYTGLIALVRGLRQRQTPAESIFWEIVRNRRFHGLKFRRQHQICLYIVDFYCHEKQLVVELDGGIHDHGRHRRDDSERDAYLRGLGLAVYRIPNDLLLNAPDRALQDLAVVIGLGMPSPAGRGLGEGW